jgi:hypothetical protein
VLGLRYAELLYCKLPYRTHTLYRKLLNPLYMGGWRCAIDEPGAPCPMPGAQTPPCTLPGPKTAAPPRAPRQRRVGMELSLIGALISVAQQAPAAAAAALAAAGADAAAAEAAVAASAAVAAAALDLARDGASRVTGRLQLAHVKIKRAGTGVLKCVRARSGAVAGTGGGFRECGSVATHTRSAPRRRWLLPRPPRRPAPPLPPPAAYIFQYPKQWPDIHGLLARLLLAAEACGPAALERAAHGLAARLLEQTLRVVHPDEVRPPQGRGGARLLEQTLRVVHPDEVRPPRGGGGGCGAAGAAAGNTAALAQLGSAWGPARPGRPGFKPPLVALTLAPRLRPQ